MICNKIKEDIPNLIRREVNTDERIFMIDHMKNCNACRNEYLNQLKMFYQIDKGLVNDFISLNKDQFNFDLKKRLSNNQKSDIYKHFRPYIYTMAAVLIFILISLFIFDKKQPAINKNQTAQIEKALNDEDWIILQKILKNDSELKKYANEKISLSLLIEKLARLEKQGIRSIDYIDLFNEANNTQNFYTHTDRNKEMSQIQINKLVQTLESFKSSQNEVTLYEIGLFLAETNKGETKS
jgi:hypothetical protein